MLSCLSPVWLFATLWTIAHQGPLFIGFFRQEYWSGLPRPPPGDLPNPGIKPCLLSFLGWQTGSLPPAPCGKWHWSLYIEFIRYIFPKSEASKRQIVAQKGVSLLSFYCRIILKFPKLIREYSAANPSKRYTCSHRIVRNFFVRDSFVTDFRRKFFKIKS